MNEKGLDLLKESAALIENSEAHIEQLENLKFQIDSHNKIILSDHRPLFKAPLLKVYSGQAQKGDE